MQQRQSGFIITILCFGFAFLYVPILYLVAYSFNKSKLVTIWGGFSTKWYAGLLHNEQVMDAAFLSLQIAAVSATFAMALGTLAGIALVRFRRFRGRTVFSGMITAPLVMPEVITGLSLLMLFIFMEDLIGWPEGRGVSTITIAHITFSMAYVAVIIQGRLSGIDESLEEAATDLGAKPFRVMWDITLPVLSPAMISGWLLSFTMSLDDLVIASFVSGPGSSTLPMVIYSKVKLGVSPDINALASIIIGLVTIGVVTAALLMFRQEKQRQADMQLAASD